MKKLKNKHASIESKSLVLHKRFESFWSQVHAEEKSVVNIYSTFQALYRYVDEMREDMLELRIMEKHKPSGGVE